MRLAIHSLSQIQEMRADIGKHLTAARVGKTLLKILQHVSVGALIPIEQRHTARHSHLTEAPAQKCESILESAGIEKTRSLISQRFNIVIGHKKIS